MITSLFFLAILLVGVPIGICLCLAGVVFILNSGSTVLPELRMKTTPARHRQIPMGTPTSRMARKKRLVIMGGYDQGCVPC